MATVRPSGLQSRSRLTREGNKIYYNVRQNYDFKPDPPGHGPAGNLSDTQVIEFNETRVSAILNDPSLYEMAIVRFTVPTTYMPITTVTDEITDDVVMSFDGLDVVESFSANLRQTSSPADDPIAIWTYQQAFDALNLCMLNAFTALKLAKPAAPPTSAPYWVFDGATGLATLIAETAYSDPTDPVKFNANTIQLTYSYPMTKLIDSIDTFVDREASYGKTHTLIIKDQKNNLVAGNYEMRQQYPTIGNWNVVTQIAFETSIPVQAELLPGQGDQVRRILTDFEPERDTPTRQAAYQFFPRGPLRWYPLNSSTPLSRISVYPKWIDDVGGVHPIYMGWYDYFSMKMEFRLKASAGGYENAEEKEEGFF